MGQTLRPNLGIEPIDDGFLVWRPGTEEVLHLTGDHAEVFDSFRRGAAVAPGHLRDATADLVELGVVTAGNGWTRRRALQVGTAGAAATVAVIALPGVAAAASPGSTDPTQPPVSTDPTTPPGPTNLVQNPSFESGSGTDATFWTFG